MGMVKGVATLHGHYDESQSFKLVSIESLHAKL